MSDFFARSIQITDTGDGFFRVGTEVKVIHNGDFFETIDIDVIVPRSDDVSVTDLQKQAIARAIKHLQAMIDD